MWVCVHAFPLFDFALSFTCVHYALLCLTIFSSYKQTCTSAIRLSAGALDLFKWAVVFFFVVVVLERCLYADWIKEWTNHKSFCILFLSHSQYYFSTCPPRILCPYIDTQYYWFDGTKTIRWWTQILNSIELLSCVELLYSWVKFVS